MSEHYLFESGEVAISRTLARFGSTSYQTANISLVRVRSVKKLNGAAIMMFIIGAALVFIAFSQDLPTETRWVIGGVGISFMTVAMVIQNFWPKQEFTFSLKTNSGDGETFVTHDRQFALDVKKALEDAFRRNLDVPARREAFGQRSPDEPASSG